MRYIEKTILLQTLDHLWREHLIMLDHLRQVIGLRGYGQRDPLIEYKKESFALFQGMKDRVDEEIVRYMWWLRPVLSDGQEPPAPRPVRRSRSPLILSGGAAEAMPAFGGAAAQAAEFGGGGRPARQPARVGGDDAKVTTFRHDQPKVGRNDPCPCGSGKKYKKCHGAAA